MGAGPNTGSRQNMASRYTARSYNGGAPAAALAGAGADGARDAGSTSGCGSVGPAATRTSQRTSTPRTADADAKRRRTSGGSTAHDEAPPSREGAPAQDTPSPSGVAAPTAAPPAAHAGLTPPHTGAADGARTAVEPLTAEALRERAGLVILRGSSGPAASGRPSRLGPSWPIPAQRVRRFRELQLNRWNFADVRTNSPIFVSKFLIAVA